MLLQLDIIEHYCHNINICSNWLTYKGHRIRISFIIYCCCLFLWPFKFSSNL